MRRRVPRPSGKSASEVLAPAVAVRVAERKRGKRLTTAGIEPWAGFIRRGLHLEIAREQEWFAANLSTFLP
ncbi:MAG: hypothetical protein ISS15_08030 [Alphaproteobacteria bacterium]|nr:hypothetical protein [Alphaproteobacteria bacterium]MBL7097589.1 hypothetical protein [Alphaproteobacteria bacterium]